MEEKNKKQKGKKKETKRKNKTKENNIEQKKKKEKKNKGKIQFPQISRSQMALLSSALTVLSLSKFNTFNLPCTVRLCVSVSYKLVIKKYNMYIIFIYVCMHVYVRTHVCIYP